MKQKNFVNKKAIITSVLMVLIICFASTAIPIVQGSTLFRKEIKTNRIVETNEEDEDYEIQFSEIFEFLKERLDDREYKSVMRSLCFLQRYYLRDKSANGIAFDLESLIESIESQDEETQKIVKNMIDVTYSAISPFEGENTPEYYTYRTMYAIADILILHFPPSDWVRISELIVFIGAVDVLIAMLLAGSKVVPLYAAVIFGIFTGLVPIIYVEIVFRMGAWLTAKSIDMAFLVVDNSTGEPINGLTITSEPLDNNGIYKFIIQEAGQLPIDESTSGWYFIPLGHNSGNDVPPGIHNISIEGVIGENEYDYWFHTPGISMNGRYGATIRIDPI